MLIHADAMKSEFNTWYVQCWLWDTNTMRQIATILEPIFKSMIDDLNGMKLSDGISVTFQSCGNRFLGDYSKIKLYCYDKYAEFDNLKTVLYCKKLIKLEKYWQNAIGRL